MPEDITVTDNNQIRDWVVNTDKKTYNIMRDFVGTLNAEKIDNTVQHTCSKCNEEFSSDINFDPSSFFE